MQQYNHTYWLLLSLPRSLSWGLYQGLCQGVPIEVRFLCQVPWCFMECEIGVRVQRCNKNPRDSSCFLNFYMKNTLKIIFLLITSLLEYKKSRQAESLWRILHHDMKNCFAVSSPRHFFGLLVDERKGCFNLHQNGSVWYELPSICYQAGHCLFITVVCLEREV